MNENNLYEGKQDNIKSLSLPKLETFTNIYSDRSYGINFKYDEFTCMCPKTALPDFATININYSPNELCLELKSFKLYLISFRNIGIFHENVVNRISDDIIEILKPINLSISGTFNSRGGILTSVTREYKI